ncbi:hypothetical protein VA7868_01076 [Vibrio aerogenes CECT 7868]|uniref:Uncharacterized protein n=1 Tax=Vibrio aerogenes CECT 7868 TaxID=1216006 RepID=A0A1M5XC16_9VIBR|nr:hypothetical protein VA7868_01076 [Vibrio aerogenes CECT 7868]
MIHQTHLIQQHKIKTPINPVQRIQKIHQTTQTQRHKIRAPINLTPVMLQTHLTQTHPAATLAAVPHLHIQARPAAAHQALAQPVIQAIHQEVPAQVQVQVQVQVQAAHHQIQALIQRQKLSMKSLQLMVI